MNGAPALLRLALPAGLLGLVAVAWAMPAMALQLMTLAALVAAAVIAWEFPVAALLVPYAIIPLGLEWHLPSVAASLVAGQKALIIALSALLVVQRGFSGQFNGPAFAFLAATIITPVLGTLHPGLTVGEMLRTLMGALTPFAVVFVRTPRRWLPRVIMLVVLAPLVTVAAGVPLQLAGIRPLVLAEFTGAFRLQGATIPAFLGLMSAVAVMAAMTEYAATGRQHWLLLAGVAAILTLASGTRMATFAVLLFCLIFLGAARGPMFGPSRRLRLWMLGIVAAGLAGAVLGPTLIERTFGRGAAGGGIYAAGRDVIWPIFVATIEQHPLFGQGMGTIRLIVPEDEVKYIGTIAAHNEYLRLSVDMGIVGVLLLIAGHFAWFRGEWRYLSRIERTAVAGFSVVMLVYSVTDNTLISLPSLLLYLWLATLLQRARTRAEAEGRLPARRSPLAGR
jgi:O-antigen ligase